MVPQLVKACEQAVWIPEHGANDAVALQFTDLIHSWSGKLTVDHIGKRRQERFAIGEADLPSIRLDDASGYKGINDRRRTYLWPSSQGSDLPDTRES